MRIIISPAKKMNVDTDSMPCRGEAVLLPYTEKLKQWLKAMPYEEAKCLWNCNDKIARLNYERFLTMELNKGLTPALLSYEGIQYQYMAPKVFEREHWEYVQEHVRILSGFYGILKPLDGVAPYRLEMQAKGAPEGKTGLYEFWGSLLYEKLKEETNCILNLASKEYAKCVEAYLEPDMRMVTCIFGELKNGKIIQKGTRAKMARGEMVRYMAEHSVKKPEELAGFNRLGYGFCEERSRENKLVFLTDDRENGKI